MKMKTQRIALLLALVLLIGLLPVRVEAASTQKLAAITFDDGPGPYTNGLLDELAKRNVKVTFFMQGYRVSKYPSVVKKAYDAGHQIASHTYDHPLLTKLSDSAIKNQITTTDTLLDQATGVDNTYMVRPPYGGVNSHVLSVLNAPAILWSVDTLDWKSLNADAVYRHIVNDTRDGSIILLHDIHKTSIPGALRGIDALLGQGYELVTVSELLRRRGQEAVPGKKYSSAYAGSTLPGISKPSIVPAETENGRFITLTADPGTKIYYTTDGTAPTAQSTLYTGPFSLETKGTVKAFEAYTLNGGRGPVAELALEEARPKAPAIALENGQAVLSSNGEIYYTLDGTMPTAASTHYTGPIALPVGTLLQAVAVRAGSQNSPVSRFLYSNLGNLFSDVSSDAWYYHDVDRAVSQGLMSADQQRKFFPDRAVTRRSVAAVLYRLAGSPNTYKAVSIPDVKNTDSAYPAIAWALGQQILSAGADGTVRPTAPVSREELAIILYRMRAKTSGSGHLYSGLYQFLDYETVRDDAWEAMSWALANGVLDGVLGGHTGTLLSPASHVTRAQLASMILRSQGKTAA